MSDDLYHKAIMERARSGLRAGRLATPDGSATVDNPLCVDRVTIDLRLDPAGRITDLTQHVRGCALCQASAATIAAHAVGASAAALHELEGRVRAMLIDSAAPPSGAWAEFAMFEPARSHKSRHDCILLPFAALERALAAADRAGG